MPVSGLTSGRLDFPASRLPTLSRSGMVRALLVYRCGGSAGFVLLEKEKRTGFPFHPVGEGRRDTSSQEE
jgi:hypothetical protein